MNYYETLYIVHPALESGRLKDIILSIQKMIESKDIKILNTDVWGKKKLAYLIDKQQYGSYVPVQLHSNGSNINKINGELEHNPDVLSYLTSRIEESNLIKDGRTLDEQILGTKLLQIPIVWLIVKKVLQRNLLKNQKVNQQKYLMNQK